MDSLLAMTDADRENVEAYLESRGAYEGILKSGIEVKAVSDECLAKSAAVA